MAPNTNDLHCEEILQGMDTGIVILDRAWRYTFVNDKALALLGISREEMLGKVIWDVFPDIVGTDFDTHYHTVMDKRVPVSFEMYHHAKDMWDDVHAFPLKDGIAIQFTDITERKQAEAARRESEMLFDSFFNASPVTMDIFDKDFRYVKLNVAAEKFLGKPMRDIIGRPVSDIAPGFVEAVRDPFEAVLKRGQSQANVELRGESPTEPGKTDYFILNCFPVRLANGERGVGVIAMNITRSKETEREVQENRSLLDTFFSNTPAGLIIYDEQNRYVRVNGYAANLYGLHPEEAIGKSIFEVLTPELARVTEQRNRQVRDENRPIPTGIYGARLPLHSPEAKETFWQGIRFPVLLPGGKTGVGLITLNVTDRVQAEEALRDSQQRYSRLFNAKIYGVAHCRTITDEQGKPVNYVILKVNDTYLRVIGIKREDIEGKLVTDVFPGIEKMPTGYIQKYGKVALEGGEIIFEDFFPATGQWLEIYAYQPKQGEFAALFTDITERKKADKLLRENELRLKAIVNNLAEGLVVVDPQGGILNWNPAALRMHGYAHHESELDFLSKVGEYFELHSLDGKYIPFERWPVNRILRGEHFTDYTIYVRSRKQGRQRIFSYNGTLVRRKDGTPLMGFLSIRDVTESKRAEETLRESEERFRTMANAMPQLAWIAKPDGYIYWYNRRWYEYTGTSPKQIEGWGWQNVHDPKVLPRVLERWQASIATGQPLDMEFPLRGADGKFRPFLTRVMPLKDREGRVVQWFGTNTDVTQLREIQKQLSDALRESRQRTEEAEEGRRILDALMANIPESIMITDEEGKILRISAYMSRTTGIPEHEAAGKPLTVIDRNLGEPAGIERRHAGRAGEEKTATTVAEKPPEYPLQRALEQGGVTTREERPVYLPDGTLITVLINAAPYRDAQGQILGAVTTWQDITDRKKAEEKIQSANRELEQFAYVASHDLQEPLRMVASFTELLERRYRGQFDERGQKYLHYIIDGAQRMQNLIQDLLTFSRVGRLDTERHPVDLNRVVDGVTSDLAATIMETHAQVTHDQLPRIVANESSMGRLFMNLISNALKFRKKDVPPKVHVSAERRAGEWRFAVSDNGIGIDPRYFGKLFVIFQRLHGREEYPGTGMGLAICKKIVENYGGRIWVESEPGKGTTFYFTIPQ